MELEKLYDLIDHFQRSDLTHLKWREGETEVVLQREAQQPVPAAVASSPVPAAQDPVPLDTDDELITAPLVGTFYASPSPDDPPYVVLGQDVKKGDVLCIIEAMKMMSEIPAPYDGTIAEIFVENEQVIGYGTPLLRLRRA